MNTANHRIEKHLKVEVSGIIAIDLLSEHVALSRQQLKSAMSNGAVWLESKHGIRRIRRAKKELLEGDILHLYFDRNIQNQVTEPATLIADLGEYSIWNKPYGMYSQGSKWGDHCTIYRWAEQHLEPRRHAYLVHRLDRAASGLIILAHNRKTATAFLKMFKQHAVTKHYRVTVESDLSGIRLPFTIDEPLDQKPARSIILKAELNPDGNTTLLIDIQTGRKHQIRRHLALMQHPVIGDRLYGSGDTELNLQLASVLLSFTCPLPGRPRNFSLEPEQSEDARHVLPVHDDQ